MIYFIVTEDNKFVKIGYTSNLKNRIVNIQNGNPYELTVIKTIKGGYTKEQLIHKQLHNYHRKGEWFYYNQYVKDFIKTLTDDENEPIHQQYDPLIDDKIEKYYSELFSNIEIAKMLSITIHKVRRVIKMKKLKSKYSHIIKPKYYHHGGKEHYVKT